VDVHAQGDWHPVKKKAIPADGFLGKHLRA